MPEVVQRNYDVAIVGSGPAGACAAIELAGSGLSVVILEKCTLPRYKTCGGGVLRRAVKLLPVDIAAAIGSAVECECRRVTMNLSPRLSFTAERATPIISITMRDQLDHLLVLQGVARGATVLQNCEVQAVEPMHDEVRLQTSLGEITAKFVIAADGANGKVARLAGFADDRRMIPAIECEVGVTDECFARLSTEARFDFDAIPAGYAWVFPKRRHLSVGVLSWQRGIDLKSHLAAYFHQLSITPTSMDQHGYVIPVSPRTGPLAVRRVLLTGDAAGLADPVTAEGITHAIQSGQLAGRTIRDGFPNDTRVCAIYNESLSETTLPELGTARRLARLLYFHPHVRNGLFGLCGRKVVEAMMRIVMGEMSYGSILEPVKNQAC